MQDTEEQLVLENMPLVYLVVNRLSVPRDDDLIQEGMKALCIAAKRYDSSRGMFSTYAYAVIWGKLKTYIRANRNLVKPIRQASGVKFAEVKYLTPDDEELIASRAHLSLEAEIFVNDFYKLLRGKEIRILDLVISGNTKREVATILGLTPATIGRVLRGIRHKYLQYAEEEI